MKVGHIKIHQPLQDLAGHFEPNHNVKFVSQPAALACILS